MRKHVKIGSRLVSVKLLAALIVCSLITAGVVVALVSIGLIQIGYKITPVAEAPTLTPSPLSLDLGSILSGSSGTKEFSKVATLTLAASWEITFTLDTTTVPDFSTFDVTVYLYEAGAGYYSYYFSFWKSDYFNSDSCTVDAGTYDITVKIDYTAVTTTYTKTGTAKVDISYPG